MATNNSDHNERKTDKFEGIITESVLKKVLEQTNSDNQEATFYMLKELEPIFYKEVVKAANDTKDFFRSKGVSGVNLDKVADVVVTFYLKGMLSHRTAVSLLEAKKLDEMYNMDYDAFCDKLIDAKLAEKKAKEAKEPKTKKPKIDSIEPKKSNKLEDLIDNSDL